MRAILAAALLALAVTPAAASERATAPAAATGEPAGAKPVPAAAPAPPQFEFEKFQLVLLRRGPSWTPEVTPEVEALQRAHIGHLEKMGEAGNAVLCGPFGDQDDPTLRGACIYRVGSVEEARRLASEDPAVQAGRLKVEVMTWAVGKGYVAFPKAPPRGE